MAEQNQKIRIQTKTDNFRSMKCAQTSALRSCVRSWTDRTLATVIVNVSFYICVLHTNMRAYSNCNTNKTVAIVRKFGATHKYIYMILLCTFLWSNREWDRFGHRASVCVCVCVTCVLGGEKRERSKIPTIISGIGVLFQLQRLLLLLRLLVLLLLLLMLLSILLLKLSLLLLPLLRLLWLFLLLLRLRLARFHCKHLLVLSVSNKWQ